MHASTPSRTWPLSPLCTSATCRTVSQTFVTPTFACFSCAEKLIGVRVSVGCVGWWRCAQGLKLQWDTGRLREYVDRLGTKTTEFQDHADELITKCEAITASLAKLETCTADHVCDVCPTADGCVDPHPPSSLIFLLCVVCVMCDGGFGPDSTRSVRF